MDTGTKSLSLRNSLTPRQIEIIQLTANGLTTKQAARRLKIAPKTVEVHKGNILKRLDEQRMIAVVALCVNAGLVR